jgi:hypothetical protein
VEVDRYTYHVKCKEEEPRIEDLAKKDIPENYNSASTQLGAEKNVLLNQQETIYQ